MHREATHWGEWVSEGRAESVHWKVGTVRVTQSVSLAWGGREVLNPHGLVIGTTHLSKSLSSPLNAPPLVSRLASMIRPRWMV
jgi:hypothetical protein